MQFECILIDDALRILIGAYGAMKMKCFHNIMNTLVVVVVEGGRVNPYVQPCRKIFVFLRLPKAICHFFCTFDLISDGKRDILKSISSTWRALSQCSAGALTSKRRPKQDQRSPPRLSTSNQVNAIPSKEPP